MIAGALNRKISVLQKAATADSDGFNSSEKWSILLEPWAQVITTGGGEFYAAQKLNAETSAVFKVRYTTKINTSHRIAYGGHIYEILNIADPDGKRIMLNVSAKETTAVASA